MSCPECSEWTKQYWSKGYPGDATQPPEPEGYVCGYCGCEYAGDPGAEVDAKYDSMSV